MYAIYHESKTYGKVYVTPTGKIVSCAADSTRGYYKDLNPKETLKAIKTAVFKLNNETGGDSYKWEKI